jgi:hypothetical protein
MPLWRRGLRGRWRAGGSGHLQLLDLRDEGLIETYQFNTKVAKHYFCKRCGVASFYIPRSHPDQIDVNLRCVEGMDLDSLDIGTFDGQNWEDSVEAYREKTR